MQNAELATTFCILHFAFCIHVLSRDASRRHRSRPSHSLRQVRNPLRASECARPGEAGGRRIDRALRRRSQDGAGGRLRQRHSLGQSAEHRPRNRPWHRPPAKDSRLHRRQSVRLGQSSHRLGGRSHLPRLCRHRDCRRLGVALRHPDSVLEEVRRRAGQREQAEERGREARRVCQSASARSRPRCAGHRRIDHRAFHGRVGGEDGQGESHLARGAGSLRAAESPPRGKGDRRRPLRGRSDDRRRPARVRKHRRHGQSDSRRYHSRSALQAPACLRSKVRHDHGRQFFASHRWRGGSVADVGGEGESRGTQADRVHPQLCIRGDRSL